MKILESISGTRTGRGLFRILSILVAGVLVWLTLRGVDFSEFTSALRDAQYWWIIPVVLITLLSHLVRAWRWRELLVGLRASPAHRIPLFDAFAALMIGYMVNYVLPRAGELVRSTHLASRQRLPLSSVIGTVVTERFIDTLCLGVGIGISAFILRAHLDVVQTKLIQPLVSAIHDLPIWELIVALAVLAAVLYAFRRIGWLRTLTGKLRPLLRTFWDGVVTGYRSGRRGLLVGSTVVMWLMYGLMAYIPLVMFGLAEPFDLSFWDAVAIMFIGVIGVAVPTPGGVGSFHYITVVALTALYGIPEASATAYAFFVHGAQLLLYLLTGLVMLLLKGAIGNTLPTQRQV